MGSACAGSNTIIFYIFKLIDIYLLSYGMPCLLGVSPSVGWLGRGETRTFFIPRSLETSCIYLTVENQKQMIFYFKVFRVLEEESEGEE